MCILNSCQRRAPESSGLEVYVHICHNQLQNAKLWQTNVIFLTFFKKKCQKKTFG